MNYHTIYDIQKMNQKHTNSHIILIYSHIICANIFYIDMNYHAMLNVFIKAHES